MKMQNYKLKNLVNKKRLKTTVFTPIIHERFAMEQAYLKAYNLVINEIAKFVRTHVVSAAKLDRKEELKRFSDNASDGTFDDLSALTEKLIGVSNRTVEDILKLDAKRHTKTWINGVKRTLGVDLKAIVMAADVISEIEAAMKVHTLLITNVSQDVSSRVARTVAQHVTSGATVKGLGEKLNADIGFAKTRAKLIARDQTNKFNSALNRTRQTQAGITHYRWRTVRDERVRSSHKDLHGNVYAWDEETGAEGGLPPGQPIQCRCTAQGIVNFGEVETNISIEDEAKGFVLDMGRHDGKEHLFSYSLKSGAFIAKNTSGKKGQVSIDPKTANAMVDSNDLVSVHHNHPSSSSFSYADLYLLTEKNNLRELWAHGLDGSSYKGTDLTNQNLSRAIYLLMEKRLIKDLQPLATAGVISADDANAVFAHILNLRIEAKGYFKYDFTMSKKREAIMEKLKGKITW